MLNIKTKEDFEHISKDKNDYYKMKREQAEEMDIDGTWFSDKEFQECCDKFGFPIIIFSISHKMLMFDRLITSENLDK